MELDDIKKMLLINKHRLDDELEVQADIQWLISENLTTANSRREEAKDNLVKVEAELSMELHETYQKITVAEVNAKVVTKPARVKAFQEFQLRRHEHEQWLGMLEAWRNRGYSLSNLCELYKSNYFAMDSDRSVTSKSDNYSMSKSYKEGREALTTVRRSSVPKIEDKTSDSPKITRRRAILE